MHVFEARRIEDYFTRLCRFQTQLSLLKGGSKGFFVANIACETMEDYKEGCLMVWANYMSPCNSFIGLYFKGTCDVISVTMATLEVHNGVL